MESVSLPTRHLNLLYRPVPSVQTACIYHRLGIVISAQYNQQIGYHSRLSLVIQINHIVLTQTFQCHLYHADSSVHNHLPGIDNRGCLLSLQHNSCDFRRIDILITDTSIPSSVKSRIEESGVSVVTV